jgi:hypothetical protein
MMVDETLLNKVRDLTTRKETLPIAERRKKDQGDGRSNSNIIAAAASSGKRQRQQQQSSSSSSSSQRGVGRFPTLPSKLPRWQQPSFCVILIDRIGIV